jgi:hypothetical protein
LIDVRGFYVHHYLRCSSNEKRFGRENNRVVEIIISSVKPFELMMGKILGVTWLL